MAETSPFHAMVRDVTGAATPQEKQRIVDRFLKDLDYPLFENESTVILIYRGEADEVRLLGDMTEWVKSIPLTRLPETDLFWFRGTYEPDARIEYVLQTPGADVPFADPLNPRRVHGFVLNSELAMPGYTRYPVFEPYMNGRTGGYELLREFTVPSDALRYDHTVHVYTPPGYAQTSQRYPCVYFQDGRDYIEYAIAPTVLDTLIRAGKISPLIGVFVTPPNRHLPETPNRTTEYGMNEEYVRFFTEELRTWVDEHFRTFRNPSARLVVGDSYGGLISAAIGLRRPDVFGMAYSQSGYMSFRSDRLLHELAATEAVGCRFFLDCGTYERCVARGIVPDEEGDFISANRRMSALMQQRGVDLVYREYHEGHTWGNWRAHLHDALGHFFGTDRERRHP